MIEKQLKTTDGKISVKIPSRLNEVSLGQLIQMQDKTLLTDLDAISILSGISVDNLKNVIDVNDFDVFADAVLSLSNQIKYLYQGDEIPNKIHFTIEGKTIVVKVINNLSVEPAGAFMAAREIVADEIQQHIEKHGEEDWQESFNPSLKANCQVLAHYFYCRVTGNRYNEYKADEFAETVKLLAVTEALPIAHANEVERFLWDHKADFPLWRFSSKNKSARQSGPRIRGIDKNNFNYPGSGYNQSNYLPLTEI